MYSISAPVSIYYIYKSIIYTHEISVLQSQSIILLWQFVKFSSATNFALKYTTFVSFLNSLLFGVYDEEVICMYCKNLIFFCSWTRVQLWYKISNSII